MQSPPFLTRVRQFQSGHTKASRVNTFLTDNDLKNTKSPEISKLGLNSADRDLWLVLAWLFNAAWLSMDEDTKDMSTAGGTASSIEQVDFIDILSCFICHVLQRVFLYF